LNNNDAIWAWSISIITVMSVISWQYWTSINILTKSSI
jgi:hypothetical protein